MVSLSSSISISFVIPSLSVSVEIFTFAEFDDGTFLPKGSLAENTAVFVLKHVSLKSTVNSTVIVSFIFNKPEEPSNKFMFDVPL